MNEQHQKLLLTFTEKLAEKLQTENTANFGDMITTDETLAEAEREAKKFAERKHAGLSTSRSDFGDTETEEQKEIENNIRSWIKRTNRTIRG
ncbi:MAG: hypothetical protein DMF63_00510 [Acidobacteria bacterium]|nr:MAG: hypothetical protein DMF63_00510 [Acidobacteriota bacterium]